MAAPQRPSSSVESTSCLENPGARAEVAESRENSSTGPTHLPKAQPGPLRADRKVYQQTEGLHFAWTHGCGEPAGAGAGSGICIGEENGAADT